MFNFNVADAEFLLVGDADGIHRIFAEQEGGFTSKYFLVIENVQPVKL